MEYRFSEGVFRQFEWALQKAVEALPDVVEFDPAPFTTTTFSRKLRNAKRSLELNQWKTTVDIWKLSQFKLIIAERGSRVITGTPESIASKKPTTAFTTNETPAIRHLKLSTDFDDVVRAALTLLAFGAVDAIDVPPEVEIEKYQNEFNFIYEREPTKTTII